MHLVFNAFFCTSLVKNLFDFSLLSFILCWTFLTWRLLKKWWKDSDSAERTHGCCCFMVISVNGSLMSVLKQSNAERSQAIKRYSGRFDDSVNIQAIMCLKLFLQTISVKLCSINLRLNACGSDRSADFADLYVVILNCDRVICNMLEESHLAEQKCTIEAHLDDH